MIASTALAALSLFVISLQVHAQISCYPAHECVGNETTTNTPRECCSMSPSYTDKSYRLNNMCRNCRAPAISFSSNVTHWENDTNATVTVNVFFGSDLSIDFSLKVLGGDCSGETYDNPMDFEEPHLKSYTEYRNGGNERQSFPIPIMINNDMILEQDEVFCVNLLLPEVDSEVDFRGKLKASITILDDDILTHANTVLEIGFKSTTYSVYEGEECLLIAVEVKNVASQIPFEFHVSAINGKAEKSSDYSVLGTVEQLATGQMIAEYYVILIIDDSALEDTENFTLQLQTNQKGVNISSEFNQTVVTIYDDDALEIGFTSTSYVVREKDGNLSFEVEIKHKGSSEIPIYFTVTDSEGDARKGDDYDAKFPIQLVLEPGQTRVQHNVTIFDDTVVEEYQETFTLHLQTNQSNVGVQDGFNESTITILDDDEEEIIIGFEWDTYSVLEDSGEVNMTIVAEGELNRPVNITVYTSGHSLYGEIDGNKNISDIDPIQPRILSFTDNNSKTVTVTIKDDTFFERDETFFAVLSVTDSEEERVILSYDIANITIQNDDKLYLSLWSETLVSESKGPIHVHVNATGIALFPVKLFVYTVQNESDGYATEGQDYNPMNVTVELISESTSTNQTHVDIYVTINNDSKLENALEKIELCMDVVEPQSDKIIVLKNKSTTTILDSDVLEIGFSNTTYSVSEGNGYLFFEVEIKDNGRSDIPIHFTVNDSQGDALRGADYHPLVNLQLTLEPGRQSVQDDVTIVNNNVVEQYQESFTLHLQTTQRNVSVKDGFGEAVVTILDDDKVTVGFNVTNYSVLEDSRSVNLTIVAKGELNRSVEVTVKTSGHSPSGEIDGEKANRSEWDIVPLDEALSFTDNALIKTVTVQIRDDTFFEGNETFFAILSVNHSVEKGVMLSPAKANITVVNDDTLSLELWSETLVAEGKGPIEVRVNVIGIVLFPVEVRVYTVSEPFYPYATEGADYELLNKTVILMSGPTSTEEMFQGISLIILDDLQLENYFEMIEIRMDVLKPQSSNMIIVPENPSSYTVIYDNDELAIGFNSDSYSVNEGDGSLTFKVVSNHNPAIPIKFTVSDTEGSAIRGEDYEELRIVQQEHLFTRSFQDSVTILNDDNTEPNEDFYLHLKPNTARVSVIPGKGKAVVTITDDDGGDFVDK